ncbi:hypothetical protein GCM10029976_067820 [Kribbella albertanoniae]
MLTALLTGHPSGLLRDVFLVLRIQGVSRLGSGGRTVRFVDGTTRDGLLVVCQLGWVPVTVTSARLITPAVVAGD